MSETKKLEIRLVCENCASEIYSEIVDDEPIVCNECGFIMDCDDGMDESAECRGCGESVQAEARKVE